MPLSQDLLDRNRRELLDLSTRNRLLSVPVGSRSARLIEIHDELSDQVYRLLVAEKKSLSFAAGQKQMPGTAPAPGEGDGDEEEIGLPQPDERMDEKTGLARRHLDGRLQTALSSEALQKRLLDLYYNARAMIEEQGVNVLYLALGLLRWFEPEKPGLPRHAPLILIPVELERKTAAEKFVLRWREEDIEENLSLQAKLKADFDLALPPFPDEEDLDLPRYFASVAAAVQNASGWQVLPNAITLGFFSFAKFLMYRDLDSANWPEAKSPAAHPLVAGLVQDGFAGREPLIPEDAPLDELIPVERLDHIMDADASQARAIEAARQGQSLIIQGPPGTGKSQCITNIIAAALLDGKKVLFVAEKLAALEVVKRRLERQGLGPLCLELHSNKSGKRAVVEEIGRAWRLGRPKPPMAGDLNEKLARARERLNQHARQLHQPLAPSGHTPFDLIGRLVALGPRGAGAADLSFANAESWTAQDLQARRQSIAILAAKIGEIGIPSQHPWRGVGATGLLALDLSALEKEIRAARRELESLAKLTADLAAALANPVPLTFDDCQQQKTTAEFVVTAPPLDRESFTRPVWDSALAGLGDLLEEGRKYAAAVQAVEGKVAAGAWEKDFSAHREIVAAHGGSWLRFLNGDYRRALQELRGVMAAELPKPLAERLALLDHLVAGQRALRALRAGGALAQSALGGFWRAEKTDWAWLALLLDWVRRQQQAGLGAGFRTTFCRLTELKTVAALAPQQAEQLFRARNAVGALTVKLVLDAKTAFGVESLEAIPLAALAERLQTWLGALDLLPAWSLFCALTRQAREQGLEPLLDRMASGEIPHQEAGDSFDRVCFSQLLRAALKEHPALARFDGKTHEQLVEEFQRLDQARMELAKYQVLARHFDGLPPHSGVGPAGILRSELERKRGHRSVRRLLRDAGSVVQAIKPVFMMSPLSVAQFLEPGRIEFDLLVIDEASQVQPVDALGAIARCRQMVVLGDSRQLPPTQFFLRLTTEAAAEEDQDAAAAEMAAARDVESILGLCDARGLPSVMLRWHYRSRHHSLIAVSNREFYENRLFIAPSPHEISPELGLRFHHVENGIFDSGKTGANRIEAKRVCQAVLEHAQNTPRLSLGVAAFSLRQRDAIMDELELLRRENPDLEDFFANHAVEPFFVKNLENVQGDERDVIFISVGYGRDASGFLAMRFGPLGMSGGERRLNVLISRARLRCEVFSSITAEEIDLARAPARGVAALKTFLAYAQSGQQALGEAEGRPAPTRFEEAVGAAIASLAHQAHPQVGVAGLFMDLAVVNPDQPGSYLLGLECDGPAYRQAAWARDRDRLRPAVLAGQGWALHRLWSADWLRDPAAQIQRLAAAIQAAKANQTVASVNASQAFSPARDVSGDWAREPEVTVDEAELSRFSTPYLEAAFAVKKSRPPHELPTRQMAEVVRQIVEVEGPVHEDEIVARVRKLWSLERAGARIQEAVNGGIRAALVGGLCAREEGFLALPGQPVKVRNREAVESANLRKPELLPPAEIRAAILSIIEAHHGAGRDELAVVVARLFGFKATSATMRALVHRQTQKLVHQGLLQESGEMLKLAPNPAQPN